MRIISPDYIGNKNLQRERNSKANTQLNYTPLLFHSEFWFQSVNYNTNRKWFFILFEGQRPARQNDDRQLDIAKSLSKTFQADTVIEVMDTLDTILKIYKNFTTKLLNHQTNKALSLSRVFISFEAFRLTLIKKDRQNEEHRKGRVFIKGAKLRLADNQWAWQ